MTKSGTFGDDADAMASQHGEFLAGVLAMARISRVTVALESGAGAGASLLEAARLTGHAETCLLFEDWEDQPLAALLTRAAQASGQDALPKMPEAGAQAQALQRLLHQAQERQRRSFLLIINRMERLLARPTHDPLYQAFEQALVLLADDRELDLHLLLVLDESAEFLLTRLQHRIPGIGDGCLRIPPPGHPAPGAQAGRMRRSAMPAQEALAAQGAASQSAGRDRSFGMLLERLTAKAPLEPAADGDQAPPPRENQPFADLHGVEAGLPPAPAVRPPAAEDAIPDASASAAAVSGTPDAVDAPDALRPQQQEAQRPASRQQIQPPHEHVAPVTAINPPSPAASEPRPAMPARRRAWPLALGLLLAAGAGMLAWQGLPGSGTGSAGPAQATQPQSAPAANDKAAVAGQPAATASAAAPDAASQPARPPSPDKPAAAAADKAASASAPAAAATANAVAASTPAVVYVHVRDAGERDRVQAQRRALNAQGIRLMEVKVTSKGPSVADLRYFHDEDRDEALAVQKALVAAGVPVTRLSRMNGFESSTRRRQYEAWLAMPAQR